MKLSTRKTLPTVIMVAITLIVLCIAAFATQGAELGTERFYNTPWALLPPVIAITLALVTKRSTLPCSWVYWQAVCSTPTSPLKVQFCTFSTTA